jgi:hypothetical protein
MRVRQKMRARARVFEHYGSVCACCGESEPKFLQIDHVNGDGAEHRRKVGKMVASWIVRNNFPPDFQILCANCNWAKGVNGQCPHKKYPAYREVVMDASESQEAG